MIDIEDIKKIKLDKDDILIFRTNIDSYQIKYLRDLLKEALPNNEFLILTHSEKEVKYDVYSKKEQK